MFGVIEIGETGPSRRPGQTLGRHLAGPNSQSKGIAFARLGKFATGNAERRVQYRMRQYYSRHDESRTARHFRHARQFIRYSVVWIGHNGMPLVYSVFFRGKRYSSVARPECGASHWRNPQQNRLVFETI